MSPKRGERVAPPAAGSLWDLRFATGEAAKGWDELCRLAPANTLVAYEELRRREIEQEPRAPAKSCVMPADLRFQGEMMLDGERGLERARPSR